MTRRKGLIVVVANVDRHGWLYVGPKSRVLDRRIKRHLAELGVVRGPKDAALFIQGDRERDEFVERYVPRRLRRDLDRGWPVRFAIDPWEYLMMVGWDASEGVQYGPRARKGK